MDNGPGDDDDGGAPVTAVMAAARLDRKASTIRKWASRYGARRFDVRMGAAVVYDFADLATIEGCIWRGDPVPATPEGRDQFRAELAAAAA